MSKPDSLRTVTQDAASRPGASAGAPGLVVLFCEGRVSRHVLPLGARAATIGRQDDQLLQVEDDPALSRRHATVIRRQRRIQIQDHDSHNGVYVNGVRQRGEVPLGSGDIVRCGGTLLQVVPEVDRFDGWPEMALGSPLLGGPAMEQVRRQIAIYAPHDLALLIEGESGTGKELVASELHRQSQRQGAYVPVNCAAIPEPIFEAELFGARRGAFTGATSDRPGLMASAAGGSLFLDEVGELPLSLQSKLLRALERKEVRQVGGDRARRVEFRLIAATNRDLALEVAANSFRGDLYHRLTALRIRIPGLRERREDIVVMARHAAATVGGGVRAMALSAGAMESLLLHGWPGNVRELLQMVRAAAIEAAAEEAQVIQRRHIGLEVERPPEGPDRLRELLRQNSGNVVQCAAELGISRRKLYDLLREHGLRPADYR
jgi:transcriptional regulator with GAF, ATPase, and Fis domain